MPARKSTQRPTVKSPAAAARTPRRKPRASVAATPPNAAKGVKAVKVTKAVKAVKPPKLYRKPVRDSFTMPEADFALIATLKARALAGRRETKKSELLRAGLHALAALDTAGLVASLQQLGPVKIGRPKKGQ